MTTDPDAQLPILRVRARDVPERVLVVGDPARAERVAQRLDDPAEISRNREYVLYGGGRNGARVGVISHGVGAAGAALCFEELCRAGVRRLVRAGTCGGMQDDIVDGDLVIARGAVRDEGVTARLIPSEFPAVPDIDVVVELRRAAAARSVRAVEGIVLTSDLFYPHEVLGSSLRTWQRAGVVAVEMECAALFVIAALHGAKAAAILAVDGNPLAEGDSAMEGYDPHRPVVDHAVDAMVDIALDVVATSP